jgi:peptidoglycan/xylan/chitin deacetylase (PgdA/CDA1 family)
MKYVFMAIIILFVPVFALSCQLSLSPVSSADTINQSHETTPTPTVKPSDPTPVPTQTEEEKTPSNIKLVEYTGKVTHIFFHPLLAYPEMAFDGDSMSKGFDDWFVTVSEFNKIIDSLYNKNYILVDINSLYDIKTENNITTVTKKKLMIPENKKPLILSIDDMNYYKYMIGNGTVSKLILDSEGRITTYSKDSKGKDVISYDNEIVPILDYFVKNHPDFSLNGAKGTIAVTGYEGVLGYRTDFDTKNNASERAEALKVITKLKETGWNFACHGYGHLDVNKHPYDNIKRDTLKWKKEVESLIGPTVVYIYPFGSRAKPDDPKFKLLVDSGFKILCGVGPSFNEHVYNNCVTSDRRHIDGISLRNQRNQYLDLFDSNDVLDPVRPIVKK